MRRRLFPLALFVVFIVVPIAELAALVWVGTQIGVVPTIAILILDALLGTWLLRSQGRTAWRRFNVTLQAGRPPAREVLDGGLIIFGGAFLITPGFLTDVIGVLLLAPPTRALFRRLLVRRFSRHFVARVTSRFPGGAATAGPRRGARPYDVEGSAVDVDSPHLPR